MLDRVKKTFMQNVKFLKIKIISCRQIFAKKGRYTSFFHLTSQTLHPQLVRVLFYFIQDCQGLISDRKKIFFLINIAICHVAITD